MFKKNFDKNSTSRNFDNFILLQSQTLEPSRQKIELELELQMGLMYESKKSLGLTGKIHQNFKKKSQKWNILKYPIIIMHLLFGQVSVGYFLHSQAYT